MPIELRGIYNSSDKTRRLVLIPGGDSSHPKNDRFYKKPPFPKKSLVIGLVGVALLFPYFLLDPIAVKFLFGVLGGGMIGTAYDDLRKWKKGSRKIREILDSYKRSN